MDITTGPISAEATRTFEPRRHPAPIPVRTMSGSGRTSAPAGSPLPPSAGRSDSHVIMPGDYVLARSPSGEHAINPDDPDAKKSGLSSKHYMVGAVALVALGLYMINR